MKNIILAIICLCVAVPVFAEKVLIFTYSYNRPDFIEIQYKTFKKFLKDDYEFVVFNDAADPELRKKINAMCNRLNIKCILIPQEIHRQPYLPRLRREDWNHPSVRNSNVVQYSLDHLGFQHPGIVALFDSDLFLIKEFSIKEYLSGYDVAGLSQTKEKGGDKVEYLWIGLAFLNMATMPNHHTINFNCGEIKKIPVDAGGYTAKYLTNNPQVKWRKMNIFYPPLLFCDSCKSSVSLVCVHNRDALKDFGFTDKEITFLHAGPTNCEFLIDTIFFHYRAGSNWDYRSQEYHNQKTAILNAFMDDLLQN